MLISPTVDTFKADFEVVSTFLEHDGKLLFLLRNADKTQGGKWGAPGGKVGAEESLETAMQRELHEETGITIDLAQLDYLGCERVQHAGAAFNYHMYKIDLDASPVVTLHPGEHSEYAWVAPEQALMLPLVSDMAHCITEYYIPTL